MAEISFKKNSFIISCQYWDNERAKAIPTRKWDKKAKVWMAPNILPNAIYIHKNYTDDEITDSAAKEIEKIKKSAQSTIDNNTFPVWYKFKNEPRAHQPEAIRKAYAKDVFALFMQMRTGKTFVTINVAAARAMEGKINALLIICPNPVKGVWQIEMDYHCPIPTNIHMLVAGDKKISKFITDTNNNGMKVLVVGIEVLSQGKAIDHVMSFVQCHKTMAVVDESSRIKNYNSIRTTRCIEVGKYALYRLILTGTPITQGIQDFYSQFAFLDWKIIGHKSFFSFRNIYCIMGGFEGRHIVGYDNVKELIGLVSPYCHIVKYSDVTDMPPITHDVIELDMSKEQQKVMSELASSFEAEIDGKLLETDTILERMIRYMQIAGGTFPYSEDGESKHMYIPGKNPKMEMLKEQLLEMIESGNKVIIWARFKPEIKMIVDYLNEEYGERSYVEYHGGVNDDDRVTAIKRFSEDDECKIFVGNQQTGGMGLPLQAARFMVYYSNSFSYEDREQSLARFWAAKTDSKDFRVVIDLILKHKIERSIVKALENKESIAQYVDREVKNGINPVDLFT